MTDPNVLNSEGPSQTSSSLLERVKTRDQAAWERLVSLYAPLVYHWCKRAGLAEPDAEDVGQEVFCSVWQKVGDFRRDRDGDSFHGWLRTITLNKVRDRARRRKGGAVGGSDFQDWLANWPAEASASAETADAADEVQLLARRALDLVCADVPEPKRLAFRRIVMGGERPADVARDLGLSLNVVYLTKSRLLHRLREEFAGLVDGDLF